jgi:hypothetical protein
MSSILLSGRKGAYQVQNLVGENDRFRYFRVQNQESPDTELMLKIGVSTAQNGVLDREAFLLGELTDEAMRLEAEYQRKFPGHGRLNYTICFPQVVETFVVPDQGNRRVVVLEFQAADLLSDLIPISFIRERDRSRVDMKSSVWILGKTLKFLDFVHSSDFGYLSLADRETVLSEKGHHLVTLLDWSRAKRGLDVKSRREEIVAAARNVWWLLGGDSATIKLPKDDPNFDSAFEAVLASLMRGGFSDAREAHSAFYQTVEAIWGRKFHPFTTLPLLGE